MLILKMYIFHKYFSNVLNLILKYNHDGLVCQTDVKMLLGYKNI